MELVIRAVSFVLHHRESSRGLPSVEHLLSVARVLAQDGEVNNPTVIASALLQGMVSAPEHKTSQIVGEFGEEVAELVAELSNENVFPRSAKSKYDLETTIKASDGAKQIAIANMICDLRQLVASESNEMSTQETVDYLQFIGRVADGAALANESLDQAFDSVWKTAMDAFSKDETTYGRCVVEINSKRLLAYSTHDYFGGVCRVYDTAGNMVAGWSPTSENMRKEALIRAISKWL